MSNDASELAARLSSLIASEQVCLKAITYVDNDTGLAGRLAREGRGALNAAVICRSWRVANSAVFPPHRQD